MQGSPAQLMNPLLPPGFGRSVPAGISRSAYPSVSPGNRHRSKVGTPRNSNKLHPAMPARPPAFSRTPEPPYYAVIFSSLRAGVDSGYGQMAERMLELASGQPGFLGAESARGEDGFGITVSYWSSEEAIVAWKAHTEHRLAQEAGRHGWYADYQVRIAKVERAYGKHLTA